MAEKSSVDIIDSVLPVYRLSKIFGLAPYTMKKECGITSFEVSWKDLAFSVTVILLGLYVTPVSGKGAGGSLKAVREFDSIIYAVKLYFPVLVDLISGLTILVHRKKFKEFFTSMLQVDARLKENNIVVDHKKMLNSTYTSLFVTTSCNLVLIAGKHLDTFLTHGLQPLTGYLWDIFAQFHTFVYLSIIMQIWIGFINISYRYHLINSKLQEYIKFNRIQLANVKIRSEIAVNRNQNSFDFEGGDIVHSIHNLCSIHKDLRSAAKTFNRIYSAVFLIILTNTFVSTTSRLYQLLPGTYGIWKAVKIIANVVYFNILNFCIIRGGSVITQEVINTFFAEC